MRSRNELSPATKVWIYQAGTEFTDEQLKIFRELAEIFFQNWESHGKPVKGTIEVFHNRFIVFFIDEQDEQACGKCVDASVRFAKELEEELKVSLLDRMSVAYRKARKIFSCQLPEFKRMIERGEVNEDTLVFNNTIHSLPEFENSWEVPVKNSWHSRMLAH